MDRMKGASGLILSVATLVFSISALVFVLDLASRPAEAVGVTKGATDDYLFTQGADGKSLYQWEWNQQERCWMRTEYAREYTGK